ncbi:MAG: 1-deoxy-D-xylulose-5-phosphate synthase, partial [Ignavibacteriales bacterium UTCHB3]
MFSLIAQKEFNRVRSLHRKDFRHLQLFAEMCRFNTFIMVKKAGSGHLGSSFSAADIVTYLYLKKLNVLKVGFDSPDRDIYFSSKGHDVPGFYSLMYALGVLDEETVLKLRRLGGVDGHPEVKTPGVEASTGSLGMGVSKAKGMAWGKGYLRAKGKVFVLTGDGEFQEGQIYEALQSTAHQKINNVTVIIDHNKYQTDMKVKDVNNIEDLTEKVSAFGWFVKRVDGHDFNQLHNVFSELDSVSDKPKLIIADTVKGKGLSFLEATVSDPLTGRTLYKWHSGAPDDESFKAGLKELTARIETLAKELNIEPVELPVIEVNSSPISKLDKEFVTDAYGDALVELAKTNDKFVVMDGDLSADCKLRKF